MTTMTADKDTRMTYENVRIEREGPIGTIVVDRPKVLNALNDATIAELGCAFDELGADAEIRVIILTGGGDKAFVAGADIAELAPLDVPGGMAKSRRGLDLMAKMESLPKPIIGAINGFALGGGCELALACDIRIASERAQLGQPEVLLGLLPGFGGTQRLPRLVGAGAARKLLYTGDRIKADEALRIGLVEEVVPADQLMARCRELATTIASRGPLAVAAIKSVVHLGLGVDLASGCAHETAHFGAVFASADQKEGCNAFLEKRQANFTGR